jgi:hypothetical protein
VKVYQLRLRRIGDGRVFTVERFFSGEFDVRFDRFWGGGVEWLLRLRGDLLEAVPLLEV